MLKTTNSKSGYLNFLIIHRRFLCFGLITAWASSFGQTFFIAFFNQDIRIEFGLSHANFGALYAVATLLGGSLLIGLGRQIDSIPLRRYTVLVCIGLALAAVLLASASSLTVLFLSICLLRLCGQGLMGHIAMTSMARYFSQDRGRAVAIASLGFPLGEALLPLLLVILSQHFMWRETWGLVGGCIAFLLLPLLFWLPQEGRDCNSRDFPPLSLAPSQHREREDWSLSGVVRDPNFYRIIPALLTLPFVITGIFINPSFIADQKSWDLSLIASGFLAFALTRIAGSLFFGHFIDHKGRSALFLPFSLLPLIGGLTGLSLGSHPVFWMIFMAAAGLSNGANGVLAGTIWAEFYGIRYLGAIRALYQTLMIFAAGVAPLLLGLLIDGGWSIEAIASSLAILAFLAATVTPRKPHPVSVTHSAGK